MNKEKLDKFYHKIECVNSEMCSELEQLLSESVKEHCIEDLHTIADEERFTG